MNYLHLITTVGEVLAMGVAVYGAIDFAKLSEAIPLLQGQTLRIRAVAGLLSALSVLFLSIGNKSFQINDVETAVQALVGVIAVWGTAHGVHVLTKDSQ